MKLMFVDTAACPFVQESRDQWLSAGGLLATTDYVIDETLTTLRFRLGLDAAEAWWLQIDGSTRLRIESIDEARGERARSLFFRYRDKDFSFTDCCSFVLMQVTRPIFCTNPSERVYITAWGCEIGSGRRNGLQAPGAGGL